MTIPRVVRGRLITSDEQNALIDQVNQNTADIASVQGADLTEVQSMIDTSVSAHVNDMTPHPEYDDLPSLSLLFENGLV